MSVTSAPASSIILIKQQSRSFGIQAMIEEHIRGIMSHIRQPTGPESRPSTDVPSTCQYSHLMYHAIIDRQDLALFQRSVVPTRYPVIRCSLSRIYAYLKGCAGHERDRPNSIEIGCIIAAVHQPSVQGRNQATASLYQYILRKSIDIFR